MAQEVEQCLVDRFRLFLVRQVPGQRDRRRAQIIGVSPPELLHVDDLGCFEFASPKSERRTGNLGVFVDLILGEIFAPGAVVLEGAA